MGGIVLAGLMISASLWGAFATWRVTVAFHAGSTAVQWQDGPDLVVMVAPLLALGVGSALPGRFNDRPLLSCLGFALLTVLIGTGLGEGDALLLEHVATANGYHYCQALDVWDPHGSHGGGPALSSWGYSRAACPASRPPDEAAPG